jgi:hypothetical protein
VKSHAHQLEKLCIVYEVWGDKDIDRGCRDSKEHRNDKILDIKICKVVTQIKLTYA